MEEKTYKLLGGSARRKLYGTGRGRRGCAGFRDCKRRAADRKRRKTAGTPGQTDFLRMQEMEFLRSSRLQIGNCVSEAFRKGDRRAQALHFYR